MKILLYLTLFLGTLFANELYHADSYSDALKEAQSKNRAVVLFTHSPFCPYCKKMEQDTLSNPKVIKLLNDKFIFVSIDLSLDIETDDVPRKFIPRGTPTTYVIDPDSQELLYSLRGYKTPKSFLNRLNRANN
jgi:thioredoxin-related protein